MSSPPPRSLNNFELAANLWTHALGLGLSLAGTIAFFVLPARHLDPAALWILGIFGLSLIALYLTSTLYHAATDPSRKKLLKYFDHSAIYLLIAGTYTPYCLLGSTGVDATFLVASVWVLAIIGIVGKFYLIGKFRAISTLIYLLMGWLVLLKYSLLLAMPQQQLHWLIAGGVSYSLGTIFYLWHRLPFNHAIWHLFVLGGSLCHYLGILLHIVLPVH